MRVQYEHTGKRLGSLPAQREIRGADIVSLSCTHIRCQRNYIRFCLALGPVQVFVRLQRRGKQEIRPLLGSVLSGRMRRNEPTR